MKKLIPANLRVRISLFYERMAEVNQIQRYLQLGEVLTRDEKHFLDDMYEASTMLADEVAEDKEVKENLLRFRNTYWSLIDSALINANRFEIGEEGFYA